MNSKQIIQYLKDDPDVKKILSLDPESTFYFQDITANGLDYLREKYPNMELFTSNPAIGVTLISSKMVNANAYAKIKLFLSREGEIISKFKNF